MTETQELDQLILKDFLAFLGAQKNDNFRQNLLDKSENPSIYNDCQK